MSEPLEPVPAVVPASVPAVAAVSVPAVVPSVSVAVSAPVPPQPMTVASRTPPIIGAVRFIILDVIQCVFMQSLLRRRGSPSTR